MVEITRENLTQFNNEGFFVAKGLLDPEIDLGPIKAEYKEVLDNAVSDLQARGIIKNNYMELPFEKRILSRGVKLIAVIYPFSLVTSILEFRTLT